MNTGHSMNRYHELYKNGNPKFSKSVGGWMKFDTVDSLKLIRILRAQISMQFFVFIYPLECENKSVNGSS